ncbi:glycerate kinase [Streptomyces scopuliridis]|uniref:glycerate kinase n=1 Tax=Streptomyces scopuliridis TaxID=452529 RepID=UPI00369E09AF
MTSVLIAPDKFKGSLTADEVAAALEKGLLSQAPGTRISRLPLADGGEGSVAAARAAGFTTRDVTVTGPTGEPVTASLGMREGTVLIEAAQICGLGVLPHGHEAPLTATNYGLGEAVRHALADAPDTIVLALGGLATTSTVTSTSTSTAARLRQGAPVPEGCCWIDRLRLSIVDPPTEVPWTPGSLNTSSPSSNTAASARPPRRCT